MLHKNKKKRKNIRIDFSDKEAVRTDVNKMVGKMYQEKYRNEMKP